MKSMPDPRPDLAHWPVPGRPPALDAGAVHVWVLELDADASRAGELHAVLSEDERERAARFRFPELRRRYTVAHAGLRILLGRYLERHPSAIAFRYAARGKPSLDPAGGGKLPRFNLAHSSELALVAVAADRIVGVDLERNDWKDSLEGVASRYFSAAECEILKRAATPSEKGDCFFSLWTRKEAILKATGEGISDLTKVEVLPELRISGDEVDRRRWALYDLPPISGFAAAIAVEGTDARVSFWRWGR